MEQFVGEMHQCKEQAYIKAIKHYNTFDISKTEIEAVMKEYKDYQLLYHEFDHSRMVTAYEPFLDWLSKIFSKLSREEQESFFKECDVYFLHQSTFQSYFELGKARRQEDYIQTEIQFETDKMIDAICKMLDYFAKRKPLFLVFNKLKMAGESTILVVIELIKRKNSNINILFAYNDGIQLPTYVERIFEKLEETCTNLDVVVDWGINKIVLPKEKDFFVFSTEDLNEYLDKLENMFATLALHQASYYLSILYQKIEIEKLQISNEMKARIFELYALVCIHLGEIATGFLVCNQMQILCEMEFSNERAKKRAQYQFRYLLGMLQIYNNQKIEAKENAKECKKIAQEAHYPYFEFKADLLAHMSDYAGWKDIWYCEDSTDVEQSLIQQLEEYKFYNHLAHVYVYAFDNKEQLYYKIEGIEERIWHFNKGIEITKKIGNSAFEIVAYRKAIMVASFHGYYDVSDYFYLNNIEAVALRTNNRYEEANIYNGLGYNCCAREEYQKAHNHYNRALKIFYEIGAQQVVAETLYNMALNALLAEDYDLADKCLGGCMKVLRILRLDSIKVCHISKIYGLSALCDYRRGIMYSCEINHNSARQFLEYVFVCEKKAENQNRECFWDDDMFLYFFVEGLCFMNQKKYKEAEVSFNKANKYVERSKGGAFFNLIQLKEKQIELYRLLGKEQEAEEEIKHAKEFCRKYHYKKRLARIEALEQNKPMPQEEKLKMELDIPLEKIIDSVKGTAILQDYETKKREMDFFAVWQKMMNVFEITVDQLILNATISFKNYFDVERFLFFRMENNKPVVKYCDKEIPINEEILNHLVQYFMEKRKGFVASKASKNYSEYKEVTSLFDDYRISTFLGVPIYVNEQLDSIFIVYTLINDNWYVQTSKMSFDNKTLSTFLFIFRQLLDATNRLEANEKIKQVTKELKEMNERLHYAAVTDPLTGLLNRQGFQNEIEKMSKKNQQKIAVLYIDLDNFKYCNDTFGHDIGDLILGSFSNVLKSLCKRENGFSVRYGGDEFIVVLYQEDEEAVTRCVQSIYNQMEEKGSFVGLIELALGKEVLIANSNKLGCSIGISFVEEGELKEEMTKAIKRADNALYDIKKNEKGHYKFFK